MFQMGREERIRRSEFNIDYLSALAIFLLAWKRGGGFETGDHLCDYCGLSGFGENMKFTTILRSV